MNKGFWQKSRELWRAELFSPKGFVQRAILICVAFAVVHLLGLREFTSVLNGTTGSVEMGRGESAMLGFIYILSYLAFVLLVPILLLAAAIFAGWKKFTPAQKAPHDSGPNSPLSN